MRLSSAQSFFNIFSFSEEWVIIPSSLAEGLANYVIDGSEETKLRTNEAAFPYIQLFLRRNYWVTKVAILSGDEPIMNLDVRIGFKSIHQSNVGQTRYTANTRCQMFYGPTLVPKQWIELDCGYSRGIRGNVIQFQLTERSTSNSPLEIRSIEIFGWGRTC